MKEEAYEARPDLVYCGRTLFGCEPVKGQELEEHYFGAIRPTVNDCMKEVDDELWKLGVPVKTKHNEVAPSQHELAPIFEQGSLAIDDTSSRGRSSSSWPPVTAWPASSTRSPSST